MWKSIFSAGKSVREAFTKFKIASKKEDWQIGVLRQRIKGIAMPADRDSVCRTDSCNSLGVVNGLVMNYSMTLGEAERRFHD